MLAIGHQIAAAGMPNQEGWLQAGELGLALVLSAAIGLEREMRQKSAGLRTYTLVGVGAALFMLISKYGFTDVVQHGLTVLDPSRVAAQIVSGIGFLGAGIIFVKRDAVRGLTANGARSLAGEAGGTVSKPMVEVTLQVHGRGLVTDLAAGLSELPTVQAVVADDLDATGE